MRTAAASCDLVRRAAASTATCRRRRPATDKTTVELLGWLELLLDDAPFAVVTGFNEGRVPESSDTDSLLPARSARGSGSPATSGVRPGTITCSRVCS